MATNTSVVLYDPQETSSEVKAIAGFLAGYSGRTREAYTLDLRMFYRWCDEHHLDLFSVTRTHIELYARELEELGRAPATVGRRLSTLAGFYRYAAEEGVIEHSPAVHVRRPRLDYESHAVGLDRNELGAFLVAAGISSPRDHALCSLLALNGLRISEALALEFEDVDLKRGVLHIRRTKFRKSRLVPMHPSVTEAMRRYRVRRDRTSRSTTWFFPGRYGKPLPYTSVRNAFDRLRAKHAWRSNGALPSPRIHDLRHAFACRRLLAWYRAGVDVDQAIASLSTYLGHGKVTDTYWYLTGTGELLSIAGDRFERFASVRRNSCRPQ